MNRARLLKGPTWARRLFAAFLCMALVLGQASYACGDPSGVQIEICSEQGVELVRVDAEGNLVEGGDMAPGECETCKFCATPTADEAPEMARTAHTRRPFKAARPHVRACDVTSQWGLWPESRGPPSDAADTAFPPVVPAPIANDFARRAPWT